MDIGRFFENRLVNEYPEFLKFETVGFEKSDILLQKDFNSKEYDIVPFEQILLILAEVKSHKMRSTTLKILEINEHLVSFTYDYLRFRGLGKDDAWEKFEGKFDFKKLKVLDLKHDVSY